MINFSDNKTVQVLQGIIKRTKDSARKVVNKAITTSMKLADIKY